MIFAYLSVNSFMRNASNPEPPAVIRTVAAGLSHSRCSTVRIACGRGGRAGRTTLVVNSLIIIFLLNMPTGVLARTRATSGADSSV